MPYIIKKIDDGYKVCKKDNSKCFSKKPINLIKAKKQLKAIGMKENLKDKKITSNNIMKVRFGGKIPDEERKKSIERYNKKVSESLENNPKKLASSDYRELEPLRMLDPEYAKEKELTLKKSELLQKNPKLREAYMRQTKNQTKEHYDQEYARIAEEQRIAREAELARLKAEEEKRKHSGFFNGLTDLFTTGVSKLAGIVPGGEELVSSGFNALRSAVGGSKIKSKKMDEFFALFEK